MEQTKQPAEVIEIEELDRELVIRAAQQGNGIPFRLEDWSIIPGGEEMMIRIRRMYEKAKALKPHQALLGMNTEELSKEVLIKTIEAAPEEIRGRWNEDNRMDIFLVKDPKVLENAGSTAALIDAANLSDAGNGKSILETRTYGKQLNLNLNEPFWQQPIAAGLRGTGFLVREDIIATASHCLDGIDLARLRFLFGFKMKDSRFAETLIPNEKIFKGIRILDKAYKRLGNKSDWALVQLERKALGQTMVKLSDREITPDEPVYVIGHPMSLPLKYSPGAQVRATCEAYFSADLDVYSRNSGSPVFSCKTHQVMGILVRGDCQDFRWTGRDWISVIYPNREFQSQEPQCTKTAEFAQYCF